MESRRVFFVAHSVFLSLLKRPGQLPTTENREFSGVFTFLVWYGAVSTSCRPFRRAVSTVFGGGGEREVRFFSERFNDLRSFILQLRGGFRILTLPETNIAPENGWLEY